MYQYSFDYSGQPIVIASSNMIEKKVLDEISDLVELLKSDLNHNIYNSAAYYFNESDINTINYASKEFLYFLMQNIKLANKYPEFNPFIIDSETLFLEDLEKAIEIDYKEKAYKKFKPLLLDTSILRLPLIIDTVSDLLIKHKVKDFLINHGENYRAVGKKKWAVNFNLDDTGILEYALSNGSLSLSSSPFEDRVQTQKFISIDKPLEHQHIILENSEGLTYNAVLQKIAKALFMYSDYLNFSRKYLSPMIVFDRDGNKHEFGSV